MLWRHFNKTACDNLRCYEKPGLKLILLTTFHYKNLSSLKITKYINKIALKNLK